jgi:hypothetical protein
MPHSLATNFAARNFNAATLANDALIFDFLIPAAGALPILYRTENPLTEQPVALRLERSVVDCLRLFDFTMGPTHDVFTARDSDSDLIEQAYVCHIFPSISLIHTGDHGVTALRRSGIKGLGSDQFPEHRNTPTP